MNIIITGASNGIGYQTALLMSQKPGTKILAVSRNAANLIKLQKEALKLNAESSLNIFALDLMEFSESEFINKIKEFKFDSIDILINNAGFLINEPFEKLTEEDWLAMYKVNVFAPVKIIKYLLPYMGKHTKTHIVNISSYGGFQGSAKFPGLSAYSSGKAALANISECLAEEFKDKNIAVNCLALGAVQTEMLSKAFPDYTTEMSAEKMAQLISDFAFNGHNYFNGKILPVTLSLV